jgi:hypothetical protein
MHAQRTSLDYAARLIVNLPGNVLEFGLGNGRTYDHLRERLPTRDIFVFDRQLAAHPASVPSSERLFLGDVLETLPDAVAKLGCSTALADLDIGSGDDAADREIVRSMTPFLLRLLKPGAVVVSGQPVEHQTFTPLAPPFAVKPGRYFLYSRSLVADIELIASVGSVSRTQDKKRTLALVDK